MLTRKELMDLPIPTRREFMAMIRGSDMSRPDASKLLGISISGLNKRCDGILGIRHGEAVALRSYVNAPKRKTREIAEE